MCQSLTVKIASHKFIVHHDQSISAAEKAEDTSDREAIRRVNSIPCQIVADCQKNERQ